MTANTSDVLPSTSGMPKKAVQITPTPNSDFWDISERFGTYISGAIRHDGSAVIFDSKGNSLDIEGDAQEIYAGSGVVAVLQSDQSIDIVSHPHANTDFGRYRSTITPENPNASLSSIALSRGAVAATYDDGTLEYGGDRWLVGSPPQELISAGNVDKVVGAGFGFIALQDNGVVTPWSGAQKFINAYMYNADDYIYGQDNSLKVTDIGFLGSALWATRDDGSIAFTGGSQSMQNQADHPINTFDWNGQNDDLEISRIWPVRTSNDSAFLVERSDGYLANVSTRYSGITELSTDWGVDDKGEPITLTDAYGGGQLLLLSDGSVRDSTSPRNILYKPENSDSARPVDIVGHKHSYGILLDDGTLVGGNAGSIKTPDDLYSNGDTDDLTIEEILWSADNFAALRSDGSVISWGKDPERRTDDNLDSDILSDLSSGVKDIFNTRWGWGAINSGDDLIIWGNDNNIFDNDALTNIVAPHNPGVRDRVVDYNSKPIAIGEELSIQAGSLELVDVLANDKDPNEGTVLTVTLPEDTEININEFASLVDKDIQVNASFYADIPPGGDDLMEFVDYTISDGELTDAAQITVTITAPSADGTLISTPLADFDSSSFDLHSSIIGINDVAVDVDGSATVQTPVVLNSDSSASVLSGDSKAVADTTSIEGITDSSFVIASDLEMAASVQSSLGSTSTSTDGIAVSNSLIRSQQGIELADVDLVDAIDVGGIANIAVGSNLTAASFAETVGDGTGNSGSLGVDGSWSNTIADAHLGFGSGDLGGILGIDVASDAAISSTLASVLSAEAVADAGVAVSNAALNASTGMEDLQVEVGGLGLVSSINQSELSSTASSTSDGASAIGLNDLANGILDSDFNFSDVDSVMTSQTLSGLDVEASTTTGDAWSSLDSTSIGFEGATSSITGAAEITAIASDQGFAESSTVSGQATALADQSAIGMDGYSINNSSDLQLSALAQVDSTAESSATMA